MTRRELALMQLRGAGERGVCGTTLVNAGVGFRYAARIHELREQGHSIRREWCKNPVHGHNATIARYFLEEDK